MVFAAQSCSVWDTSGTLLLDLHDGDPAYTETIDLGSPDVRAVADVRSAASGTIDSTQYHGSRAVTWTGFVPGDDLVLYNRFCDALRGICHPGRRYYLHVQAVGWEQERRALVRADQITAPLTANGNIQTTWVGVDGVLEDISLYEYNFLTDSGSGVSAGSGPLRVPFTVPASISGTTGTSTSSTSGLPFPIHFPFGFRNNVTSGTTTSGGSSDPSTGALVVHNPGTTGTPPVFRIYGPCTGPQIICATTGLRMSWPDVSLNAGDYLNVDCKEQESTFGGDPNSPQGFDFNVSDWLSVPVGDSQWQLTAASSAAGWGAVMDVRFRWL